MNETQTKEQRNTFEKTLIYRKEAYRLVTVYRTDLHPTAHRVDFHVEALPHLPLYVTAICCARYKTQPLYMGNCEHKKTVTVEQ